MNRNADPALQERAKRPTAAALTRAILAGLAVTWVIFMLGQIIPVILIVLFAAVLAAGLDPLIEAMHRWRPPFGVPSMPRGLAALLLLIGMAGGLTAGIAVLVVAAWNQASDLLSGLPAMEQQLFSELDRHRAALPWLPSSDELVEFLRQQAQEYRAYLQNALGLLANAVNALGGALLVLALVLYMHIDKQTLHEGFLALVPPHHRKLADETARETLRTVGGWLRGQILLMALVGTIIGSVAALFGLPYPLLLALVGALGELVPMVGPIAAGLVVVPVAALTQPLGVTIALIAFFLIFSVVEGNYIVPKIMQANVNLPPFFTVLVVVAGASWLGVGGALLAIPLAAGLRVILRRVVIPAIQRSGDGSERGIGVQSTRVE